MTDTGTYSVAATVWRTRYEFVPLVGIRYEDPNWATHLFHGMACAADEEDAAHALLGYIRSQIGPYDSFHVTMMSVREKKWEVLAATLPYARRQSEIR